MAQEQVKIFDTTLRDGEQAAGAGMTTPEKLEIARQLDRLGVDVIEAGFAASSPGDFEAVATVAREVRRPIIASLARAHPNDVDQAWNALQGAAHPRIHVFLSSSDIHLMHQLRKNREEVMDMAVSMVARAKGYCEDVEFSAMDASRTEPEYLYTMLRAVIEAGATTINIPDTVGYSIPEEFARLLQDIQENVPNIHKAVLSVHCHNDLGLGVANSMAAIQVGARQVEGCINGLGERAGNAALEEIIMSIETRPDFLNVFTNVDTTQIYRTSRLVSDVTGFPIQPNKAVVGLNAFRHASGIHQDGILKERSTYEVMDPASIGWPGTTLVLGKLSGRAGLRSRLEELGYHLDADELAQAFEGFKLLADKKREITDLDLEALMSDQRRAVTEDTSFTMEHIPGFLRRPRNPHRDGKAHRPGRLHHHRRRHRHRPRRRHLQGHQPNRAGAQHPVGIHRQVRHRRHRRHRRGDHPHPEGRRRLRGPRLGYGHPGRQRQGLSERPQPPACDGRGQEGVRRRSPQSLEWLSPYATA